MKSGYIFLIFFCFVATNAFSQWTKLPGPSGGTFNDIDKVGNELWLSSTSGLYISQNEGLTWEKSTLIPRYCHDVIAYNDTVVIIYADVATKCLSSFDGGITWQNPSVVSTSGSMGSEEIVKSSKTLFYKTSGVYRQSSDGGLTWTIMSLYLSNLVSDSIMIMGVDYTPVDSNNYYYSLDGNLPWNLIYTGTVFSSHIFNDCFFISVYDTILQSYKLLKSCDFGSTWNLSTLLSSQITTASFVNFNDTLYLYQSLPSLTMMSTDNGDTWVSGTWPNQYLLYPGIYTSNGNRVLLNNIKDVVTYVPSQNLVIPTNTGTAAHRILSLYSNQNALFAASYYNFYKSLDGGLNWVSQLNSGIINMTFKGDTVYAINWDSPASLVKSYNNGTVWDTLLLPLGTTGPSPRISIAKLDSQLFIGYNYGLIVSLDEGLTWDSLPELPSVSLNGCSANYYKGGYLNNCFNKLYALSKNGYVFRLNDSLQTWETLSTLCSSGYETDRIFTIGNKLLASFDSDLFISSDSGYTWIMSPGLVPKSIVEYNGTWFGILGLNEVLYSIDEGITWNQLDSDTTFNSYRSLCVLNGVFYADGYCDGIYRRSNALFPLSGNVYHDQNNDGIKNNGEPAMQQIIISSSPAGFGSTIDSAGDYTLITDMPGNIYAIAPSPYVSVNPASYTFSGTTDSLDFGIYLQPNVYDLKADITNTNVFNPGFATNLQLTIKNFGNYSSSPVARMLLDTSLLFINATPAPDYFSGDTAVWLLSAMNFLDQVTIQVEVETKVSTPIGLIVTCYLEALPVIGDTLPVDNYASLRDEVVGSFDPNDKTCLQGNIFTPAELQNDTPLEYVIRFQNTGNFPTAFVSITDTLSPLLDFTTFSMISSSHPCSWSLSGHGILRFTFNPLALPPESTDELNSHGFIKYSIKCKNGISIGSAVDNTAAIVFDFNLPIITNTVTTLVSDTIPLNAPEIAASLISILPFPNPTSDFVYIKNLPDHYKGVIIAQTYNSFGKLISNESISQRPPQIDVANFSSGVYITRLFESRGNYIGFFKFIRN